MKIACSQCHSENNDDSTFCFYCGSPLNAAVSTHAAHPSTAPPMPFPSQATTAQVFQPPMEPSQTPYPTVQQQPYDQSIYDQSKRPPSSFKKTKKTGLIVSLISIGMLALVTAAVLLLLLPGVDMSTRRIGSTDTYEIGGDKIPSVTSVLGERTLDSFTSGTRDDGTLFQTYSYLVDFGQGLDMNKYLNFLETNDNYFFLTEVEDYDVPTLSDVLITNGSDTPGYVIVISVSWDTVGYSLTITRGKGELIRPGGGGGPVDDPPLIKAFMDRQYGFYCWKMTIQDQENPSGRFLSYHMDGQSAGIVFYSSNGGVLDRLVFDLEKHIVYEVYDDDETYVILDDIFFYMLVFYPDATQVDSGNAVFEEDVLPYIDYKYEFFAPRCFLKDGDVFAIQTKTTYRTETMFIQEVYDGPIDEFLHIPDHYTIW